MNHAAGTHSFRKGVYYMVISAIWFAITYLFVKLCTGKIPYFLFTFLRFILPCLILFVILLYQKKLQRCFQIKGFHTHILRAIFVAIAQFSIFYYISKSSLLNATLLLNTGPLFIPLIEWLMLGNRIGKSTLVSLVVAFIGVILILQPGSDLFSLMSFIGLLAGFSQACSQLLYGGHVQQESIEINQFILYFLTSCISLIPLLISSFVFSFEVEQYPILLSKQGWYLWLFLMILSFANIFNQYFRGLAYLRGGKPATLSTFLYLSVFFAAIFDWTIFDLEPNIYSILGGILVITSGVIKIVMRHYILKGRHQK